MYPAGLGLCVRVCGWCCINWASMLVAGGERFDTVYQIRDPAVRSVDLLVSMLIAPLVCIGCLYCIRLAGPAHPLGVRAGRGRGFSVALT